MSKPHFAIERAGNDIVLLFGDQRYGVTPQIADQISLYLTELSQQIRKETGEAGSTDAPVEQQPLNEMEGGELRLAVSYDPLNNVVRISFGTPVSYVGLDLETAKGLIQGIREQMLMLAPARPKLVH